MGVLENLLVGLATWLADHSYPALAGFIGGLVGAEVGNRWRNRGRKHQD